MDTRNLQTFLTVCDVGSFTKAASELGYAQSTVTAQIQQLETELGYPLFDRIGKRVYVTAQGQSFQTYAEEILCLWQQSQFLGKNPSEIQGTLRVGVLESLLYSVLTELLPSFKAAFPKVDLQIKMGRAAELLTLLRENKVDLVYYSHNRTTDSDFTLCYCRRETLCFIAPPDHPLGKSLHVPLAAFLQNPVIVTEQSGICYQRLSTLAGKLNLELQHTVEVDNTRVIADLVSHGMGCAFLPRYSVLSDLNSGRISEVHVDLPEQVYYSQIIHHRGKWLAPYASALIDLIRQHRPESS